MEESEIKKLTGLYLSTAKEYIDDLKKSIALLKVNPTDSSAIAAAYISSHSLKSQSLVMRFKGIGQVSGTLEFTLREIKEGKKILDTQLLSLIEHVVLTLSFALQSITDGSGEPDLSSLVQEIESGTGIHFPI